MRTSSPFERGQGAQVNDLDINAFGRDHLGRAQRFVQHQPIADHGQVAARALDICFANRHHVIALRHLAFDQAIGLLVFQEQHRVGHAQGRAQQALHVIGCARRDDVETGHMAEKGLDGLRMIKPAADTPAIGRAYQHRHGKLTIGAIAETRGFAHNLVERWKDEIGKLNFADRAHAIQRHANADRNDGQLRERAVYHPIRAELIEQALGGAEYAAAWANVFARDDDGGVTTHLFRHGIAEGFNVCFNCHGSPHILPKTGKSASSGLG